MIEFTKTYGKKNNDGTPKIFTHDVFLFQGRYGRFNPLFFFVSEQSGIKHSHVLGDGFTWDLNMVDVFPSNMWGSKKHNM